MILYFKPTMIIVKQSRRERLNLTREMYRPTVSIINIPINVIQNSLFYFMCLFFGSMVVRMSMTAAQTFQITFEKELQTSCYYSENQSVYSCTYLCHML